MFVPIFMPSCCFHSPCDIAGVLSRMTKELEQLSPSTLQLLEAYFRSPQSKFARSRKIPIPVEVVEARSKPTHVTVSAAPDHGDAVSVSVEANPQYVDPATVVVSSTELEEEVGYEAVPHTELQGQEAFWDVQTVQVRDSPAVTFDALE